MSETKASPSALADVVDIADSDVQRRRERLKLILGFFAILLIMIGSFWIALHPEWLARFGNWGYVGAFAVSMITSATLILPAPGIAVVIAMGTALNPVALSISAGLGSAVGELSGYAAGAGGRALVKDSHQQWLDRIHRWAENSHAPLVFFLLAAMPFPLFDLAGIAAGMSGIRIPTFLLAVALGKTVKYLFLILLIDFLV